MPQQLILNPRDPNFGKINGLQPKSKPLADVEPIYKKKEKVVRDFIDRYTPKVVKDFGKGLIGTSSVIDEPSPDYTPATAAGELLGILPAGAAKVLGASKLLPLMMGGLSGPELMKKLNLTRLFHGSRDLEGIKKTGGIDPSKFNIGDTLGSFFHAAENKGWSDTFKGASWPNDPTLKLYPEKVENVLDLIDIDPKDLEKLYYTLPPSTIKDTVKSFIKGRESDPGYGTSKIAAQLTTAYPGLIDKAGFDAIRYRDVEEPAWAIRDVTKLTHDLDIPVKIKKPLSFAKGSYSKLVAPYSKTSKDYWHVGNPIADAEEIVEPLKVGGEIPLDITGPKANPYTSWLDEANEAKTTYEPSPNKIYYKAQESKVPGEDLIGIFKDKDELTEFKNIVTQNGGGVEPWDSLDSQQYEKYLNGDLPGTPEGTKWSYNYDKNLYQQYNPNGWKKLPVFLDPKTGKIIVEGAAPPKGWESYSGGANKVAAADSETSGLKPVKSPKAHPILGDDYEYVGQAGGSYGAEIVKDRITGTHKIFKPYDNPIQEMSENIGSTIAYMSGSNTPLTASAGIPKSKGYGTVQNVVPGKLNSLRNSVPSSNLSEVFKNSPSEELKPFIKEHMIDWMISNHDAHGGNFLLHNNGDLYPIDKGQSFKYFMNDKLSPNYHPNALYGEDEPIYNHLMRLAENRELNIPDKKWFSDVADSVTEMAYSKLPQIKKLAEERYKLNYEMQDKFIERYMDRIKTLKDDFLRVYKVK